MVRSVCGEVNSVIALEAKELAGYPVIPYERGSNLRHPNQSIAALARIE
jgi:hypothetical protein